MSKYFLASAWIRSCCRVFDLLVASGISIGVNVLVIYFCNPDHTLNLASAWYLALIIVVTLLVFITYFILIPLVAHGKTLGNQITKTRTIVVDQTPTFFALIKKELFIWMDGLFIYLLLSLIIIGFTPEQFNEVMQELMMRFSFDYAYQYGAIVGTFGPLTAFYALFTVIIFGNMCFKNRHRCLNDVFSHTAVIKNVKITKTKTPKQKPSNFVLPGTLSNDSRRELDKIDDQKY